MFQHIVLKMLNIIVVGVVNIWRFIWAKLFYQTNEHTNVKPYMIKSYKQNMNMTDSI